MTRLGTLATLTMLCTGVALYGGDSVGQEKPLKDQIVGTWTLVSVTDVSNDGARVNRLGPNPKGSLVLDGHGRYTLVIVRSDLPKFASNKGDQGTAEEDKAVMQGLVAHFGYVFRRPGRQDAD